MGGEVHMSFTTEALKHHNDQRAMRAACLPNLAVRRGDRARGSGRREAYGYAYDDLGTTLVVGRIPYIQNTRIRAVQITQMPPKDPS